MRQSLAAFIFSVLCLTVALCSLGVAVHESGQADHWAAVAADRQAAVSELEVRLEEAMYELESGDSSNRR